jgi:hypothetical protein
MLIRGLRRAAQGAPRNAETLFHLALQKPASERAALLEQACAGDAALRQCVEALLKAHENPGSFLAKPAVDLAATQAPHGAQGESGASVAAAPPGADISGSPISDDPGARIGPYKLLQQIGEGGMGTVYLAEQETPVRRRVALKIIKPGLDSKQVIARFEADRQALALMDHPNIARVLDAGTIGSEHDAPASAGPGHLLARRAQAEGRPYFVMELVRGVPITKYCDIHHLTPREAAPDPDRGRPLDTDWNEWQQAQILCREAEALLKQW